MKLNNLILFASLLIITLYIPLSYTIYSSNWYPINYNLQDTYSILGQNETLNVTSNLIGYFMHNGDLNSLWSDTERLHYQEVRLIYDIIFVLFFLSLICIVLLFDKAKVMKYSKFNMIGISSLILILPFFSYFWNRIFHPLFFNNDYWIMNVNDISYYLFSIADNGFFVRSFIFIIVLGVLINLFVYYLCKKN